MKPSRLVVLVALSGALLLPSGAAAQQPPQQQPERGITVVGTATTFAANDLATFRIGVSTRRSTAGAALRAAAAVQRRIVAAVRARGVAAGDVRTNFVSVGQVTRRGKRRYAASNNVRVTIRDIARSGEILDAAVRAGASEVDGPRFEASDVQAAYRNALAAAYLDARAKAERLAQQAGVALGAPLRLIERGAFDNDDGDGSGLLDASTDDSDESGASTPLSPGRTEITAAMTVTFATG